MRRELFPSFEMIVIETSLDIPRSFKKVIVTNEKERQK